MVVAVVEVVVVEVATAVEEAGTTEDRTNGEVEEGVELEEVGGEEDGVEEEEEEIPDNHQITKTSDTRMTSIPRAIGILATVTTGHQEAGEVSSVIIRDLLITTKIRIKEVGDMDQLVLAMIVTTSIKRLRLLNSVIQGILRKLLGGHFMMLFFIIIIYIVPRCE
jgi:hypothetical protein